MRHGGMVFTLAPDNKEIIRDGYRLNTLHSWVDISKIIL